MPTYEETAKFWRDYESLSPEERDAFREVVALFVEDLRNEQQQVRPGFRIKRVQGTKAIWEFTWAPDGRATFEYGVEKRPGEVHIIWRRVGGHEIFSSP